MRRTLRLVEVVGGFGSDYQRGAMDFAENFDYTMRNSSVPDYEILLSGTLDEATHLYICLPVSWERFKQIFRRRLNNLIYCGIANIFAPGFAAKSNPFPKWVIVLLTSVSAFAVLFFKDDSDQYLITRDRFYSASCSFIE